MTANSNDMGGNDHFYYALDALGDRRNSPEAAATLALAFEQRTTNLLALHAALRERRDNRQALDLLTVIKERLVQ